MPSPQLLLAIPDTHGGRRRGAGRPNRSGLRAHVARPRLTGRHPVHVTLRLVEGLPSLRRKDVFRCLRAAVRTARGRGFGANHFAILGNHVHLLLEPPREGCGRPIQSLSISFARRMNRLLGRRGPVFHDRYHLHVLRTPTETRRALACVLANDSRHRGRGRPVVTVDPFSSVHAFRAWKRLFGARALLESSAWPEQTVENWLDEILVPARTWLLRVGWMRGLPAEVPG